MTTQVTSELDSEEFLHLAMQASARGEHEQAISSLKRALAKTPGDGRIHYLLGAEHAQIGMYDRACEEMRQAVELDPKLDTAHFQLGLLHITSARPEQAAAAWKPLDALGPEHSLYLFKIGLLHLARDEFNECGELLKKGIALNRSNPALNNDMQRVLQEVERHLQTAVAPSVSSTTAKRTKAPRHVLLSAYRQDDEKKDR